MRNAALIGLFLAGTAFAVPGLAFGQSCLPPEEPYPYEPPDDPKLRDLVNQQYAEYMEQVEDYLNCLQLEYRRAFEEAKLKSQQWRQYFGDDAAITSDLLVKPTPND